MSLKRSSANMQHEQSGSSNSSRNEDGFDQQKRTDNNSTRLEEILAELMKPVQNPGDSFTVNQCALLEEYLNAANLRGLDQKDYANVEVNYDNLGRVLESSVDAYARKVDELYLEVLRIRKSLNDYFASEEETEVEGAVGGMEPATSVYVPPLLCATPPLEFEEIRLESIPAAILSAPVRRASPLLPRAPVESESPHQHPTNLSVTDYQEDIFGKFSDLHAVSRLQDGVLMMDLADREDTVQAKPTPQSELLAALEVKPVDGQAQEGSTPSQSPLLDGLETHQNKDLN
ncbi:hypothetical protein ACJJTC_000895 [Scirpophaga incertulas]